MSNVQIVQNFINSENDLYCDDCLSEKLDIKPRQQVNQICNKLKKQGLLKREVKQCSSCSKDKLINKLEGF
ncbi:MarR family transcriptional regulator [Lysinibacillus sp. G01H]|uniref:MarR family transcriptional regulator n=1 Tax=Lysinibacillus sp. G01H TaxID=3026425 RepID=UPI00237DF4D4|nr:helix-turn-helix domain-containing protein [Lysinibacillus sp. G01H]WDU81549.1 helix-turn-helix domain-containing protein [Lysinibacillus sp. G01H]